MESYYTKQASALPFFSGHYRQNGSGFGALAGGIGRIALPLARKFIIPAAKRVGKELLLQSVPELMEVVSKKNFQNKRWKTWYQIQSKSKQVCSLALRMRQKRMNRRRSKHSGSKARKVSKKRKVVISKHKQPKRSRSDFFAKVKDATHSSFVFFSKNQHFL